MQDDYLKYKANFDFVLNKGSIVIENYWQQALKPFLARIYAYYLLKNKGVFLHGACAIKNNTSHIFLGNSGFGKTTISKRLIPKGYNILHDDLICIKKIKGIYKVFTHPFQQHSLYSNNYLTRNINKIYILRKDKKSRITKIYPPGALLDLIRHTYLFNQYNFLLKENFCIACELVKNAEIYEFNFSYHDNRWLDLF